MRREDRETVERIRQRFCHDTASHSFLSLFIYGGVNGYELFACDDGFAVRDKNGEYLFPVGTDEYKEEFIKSHKNCRVYMARQSDVEFALSVSPGSVFEADPDRSEYVYDKTEQTELTGHKFQKVRAKLSRFYRENNVKNALINAENINDAYKILAGWSPKSGDGDIDGAKKALDNFIPLGLSGDITYIDGQPVGYCLGGDLGGGVYMLCSAKQTSDIQGLNLSTKHELYKALPDGIKLINTESDHGSPGIRMHKNDLRPVFLNKMYKGVL